MKTVLLFKKPEWNKKSITKLLDAQGVQCRLRLGFGYLLAICETEVNCPNLAGHERIIAIGYDSENRLATASAYLIDKGGFNLTPLQDLLASEPNLAFDIQNFGFVPPGGASIEVLYETVRNSHITDKVDVLKSSECGDLIHNKNLSDDLKKIILDIFTLRATAILLSVRLSDPSQVLAQYSNVFLLSFVTRAQFEKLMLLLAKIDDALDYSSLDQARRMKAAFKKQASIPHFL